MSEPTTFPVSRAQVKAAKLAIKVGERSGHRPSEMVYRIAAAGQAVSSRPGSASAAT